MKRPAPTEFSHDAARSYDAGVAAGERGDPRTPPQGLDRGWWCRGWDFVAQRRDLEEMLK